MHSGCYIKSPLARRTLEYADPRQPPQLPPTPIARVLVVEDNKDVIDIFRLVLPPNGYELAAAFDGIQGINSAMFFRPHIIFLNLQMPRMGGHEAFPILRRLPGLSNTKIVMISGYSLIGEFAQKIGADGFYHYPLEIRKLLIDIPRLLASPT